MISLKLSRPRGVLLVGLLLALAVSLSRPAAAQTLGPGRRST